MGKFTTLEHFANPVMFSPVGSHCQIPTTLSNSIIKLSLLVSAEWL